MPNRKEIKEYPPNYEQIKETFPVESTDNVVFTYGDTLYNPHKLKITEDLWLHEEVHQKQQVDPKQWWDMYCENEQFRLDQELEAYGRQYAYIKSLPIITKERRTFLDFISEILSSNLYGNIISFKVAESKIRNKAKKYETTN